MRGKGGGSIPYLKLKVLICSLSVTFLKCWTISHLSHANELTRNKTFFNLFVWYVLLFYLVFTIFFYVIFVVVPFINCSYFIYKYYFWSIFEMKTNYSLKIFVLIFHINFRIRWSSIVVGILIIASSSWIFNRGRKVQQVARCLRLRYFKVSELIVRKFCLNYVCA